MLKRIISLLICAVLLLSAVHTAVAATVNLSGLVNGTSRTRTSKDENGNVVNTIFEGWAEYVNPTASADVRMDSGEYVTLSPLHWLDSKYLSYEILAVENSNPSVVTATTYLPQIPNTNELVLIDLRGGRENLGLQLHALYPGEAVITLMYRTYRTEAGLDYTDKRGSDTYIQQIYVTVNSPIEVSLTISGGGCEVVKSIAIESGDATEDIPEPLRNPALITAADLAYAVLTEISDIPKAIVDAVSSDIFSDAVPLVTQYGADRVTDYLTQKSLGSMQNDGFLDNPKIVNYSGINKALYQSAMKGVKIASKVIPGADIAIKVAEIGYRRKATVFPKYTPNDLKLNVKIKNVSDSPLTVPRMTLQANEYISFSSSNGPWANSYNPYQSYYLVPGQEVSFSIPIYARLAVGDLSDYTASNGYRLAYTGNIAATCYYYHSDYENTTMTANESVQLSAYSNLTLDDLSKYWRAMSFNPDYFINRFNATNLDELLYIGCPVDIIIADAKGKELAVIRSNDAEGYYGEGIMAAALGEDKIIALARGAWEYYQIMIRAVGEGTMDVITSGLDLAGDHASNIYIQTPIAAGDTFSLMTSEDGISRLYRVAEDGAKEAMEIDLSFNRAFVETALDNSDLSPQYKEAVVSAYLHNLLPDIQVSDSFQAPMSVNEFFGAFITIYELYYNLPLGSTAVNYIWTHPETKDMDYVTLAAFLGFITAEQLEQLRANPDEALTRDNLVQYVWSMLSDTLTYDDLVLRMDQYQKLGLKTMLPQRAASQQQKQENAENQETNENASEKTILTPDMQELLLYLALVVEDFIPADLVSKEIITREIGIFSLSNLWKYLDAHMERNHLIISAIECENEKMVDFNAAVHTQPQDEKHALPINSCSFSLKNQPLYYLDETYANFFLNLATSSSDAMGDLSPIRSTVTVPLQFRFVDGSSHSVSVEDGYEIIQATLAYIPDAMGNIYEDALYLIVLRTTRGQNELGQVINNNGKIQAYHHHFMIISDQEIVKAYAEMVWPKLEKQETPAEEAPVYPELAKGSQGDDVILLQERLIDLGHLTGKADGDYGNKTATAVSAFQKKAGLPETGVADSQTQTLLFARRELSKGSKGSDVQKLQQRLIDLGYLTGSADGDYGNKTVSAVTAYQKAVGVAETGVADLMLQEMLFVTKSTKELLFNWLEAHQ